MREQVLFEDARIRLARYDHALGFPHHDPPREESAAYAVSFVERGSFTVHRGRASFRLSPAAVFVTRPGMRYRCTHESDTPDDVCLSLHVPAELVEQAVSSAARPWDAVLPGVPLSNRLAYLHRQIGLALADGVAPLALPALVPDVLGALLVPANGAKPFSTRQLAWYAERIDTARELMERRFAEPLTLELLGREVGISAFHFSRLFHELVGLPPHRYLVRVRLARAAEALSRGASVTAASRDSGFPNLGHFIRRFRRAHGVSPSRYRESLAK